MKKGNKNMYNVIVQERKEENIFKKNTETVSLKRNDDFAKFIISQKVANAVSSDLERLSILMMDYIMEGLIDGRK